MPENAGKHMFMPCLCHVMWFFTFFHMIIKYIKISSASTLKQHDHQQTNAVLNSCLALLNQVCGCLGNPLWTSQAQLGGNPIPWNLLVELAHNSYGTPYWKITINRSITSMAKKFKSLSLNIYISKHPKTSPINRFLLLFMGSIGRPCSFGSDRTARRAGSRTCWASPLPTQPWAPQKIRSAMEKCLEKTRGTTNLYSYIVIY